MRSALLDGDDDDDDLDLLSEPLLDDGYLTSPAQSAFYHTAWDARQSASTSWYHQSPGTSGATQLSESSESDADDDCDEKVDDHADVENERKGVLTLSGHKNRSMSSKWKSPHTDIAHNVKQEASDDLQDKAKSPSPCRNDDISLVKSEVQDEDEHTDLDVLRFRSHLSAFAATDASSTKRTQSGSAVKLAGPQARKGLASKAQSAPEGLSAPAPAPDQKPASKAAAKARARGKKAAAAAKPADAAPPPTEGPSADDEKFAKPKPRKRAATKKSPAKTDVDSADDAKAAEQSSTSPTKMKSKRGPKTPPPDPLDLSDVSSAYFLVLTSCPLCAETFPKYKSGPIRRRHVGVCAAKQSLEAPVVAALVTEEVARLDKAERANRTHEEELKTTWQLVTETSRLPVRDVEEDELWDALGFSRNNSRRKASAIAKGAVRPGETGAPKRRRLAGSTGSLLTAPSISRRSATRAIGEVLDGDPFGVMPLTVKAERTSVKNEQGGDEEQETQACIAHGMDYDTGDVISDASEPAFAFPMDQRLAEMRFLSTPLAPEASQSQFHHGDTQSRQPLLYAMDFTSLPSSTQTFTQAPSTTFRARSSSRLWKKRRLVPGAGTGLGVAFVPLSQVPL